MRELKGIEPPDCHGMGEREEMVGSLARRAQRRGKEYSMIKCVQLYCACHTIYYRISLWSQALYCTLHKAQENTYELYRHWTNLSTTCS